MTADRLMSEDRSDLTLALLTDMFKTQMSPVTSCLKASWAKETKMSHAIDSATTGLAKLLDPISIFVGKFSPWQTSVLTLGRIGTAGTAVFT